MFLSKSVLQVPIYIQGLVVGSLKLDHKGQTQVICKATGNRTAISVSGQGTLSRLWKGNNHQVYKQKSSETKLLREYFLFKNRLLHLKILLSVCTISLSRKTSYKKKRIYITKDPVC